MIDTRAMKVPVLLAIVGVTFMLCGQVSTSCSCTPPSPVRGECRTFYRGKKFCYVNPGQCPDQIKGSSPLLPNRFWSYQACEKMEQQCYTVRGNQCQFPFSYKGRTFSSCTTFDSENRAAWCTTKEGRYEDCVSHLPPVLETQLSRNLAGTVAQRTTPVGRERGTVTQTTRAPVRQVSGAETQTVETSTLPTMHQRTAATSRSTKYYNVNEDGYISCRTRADCPPDVDTELHMFLVYSYSYSCGDTWIEDICSVTISDSTASAVANPLTWSSAIGGTGSSSATNPNRYDECGPRYCRRGNKCCLLVYIGYSNRYLGCPSYC